MRDEFEQKKFWKRVNVGLVVLMVLMLVGWWQKPSNNLELVFCDVGQGDTTLVIMGSYQLLVDGGPDDSVLSCLGKNLPFWDRKIEMMVMTHPQADHMTGFIEVLRRYEVERVMMSSLDSNIVEFKQFEKQILESRVEVKELIKGERLVSGELKLEVVWPNVRGEETKVLGAKDPNDVSTVLWGKMGEFDFLLTGDIGKNTEDQLGDIGKIEVLKVAHHGSRFSSSEEFLRKVSPKLSVISVGGRNRFGHPTKETLARLAKVGSRILRTDKEGTIKIVSDGKRWWRE